MAMRPDIQWTSVTRGRTEQKVGFDIIEWDLTNDGLGKIRVATHV